MTALPPAAAPLTSLTRRGRVERVFVLILVALCVGAVGGATGAWVGWQSAPALPESRTALDLLQLAMPGSSAPQVTRADGVFVDGYPDDTFADAAFFAVLGTDDYGPGMITVHATVASPPVALAGAYIALQGNGWHVYPVVTDHFGQSFGATRGRYNVEFSIAKQTTDYGTSPNVYEPAVELDLLRVAPAGLGWKLGVGWLIGTALGAVLGRLVGLGLGRLSGTWLRAWRPLIWTSLGTALPAALITVLGSLLYQGGGSSHQVDAPWFAYVYTPTRVLTFGAGWLAITAAVMYVAGRRAARRAG